MASVVVYAAFLSSKADRAGGVDSDCDRDGSGRRGESGGGSMVFDAEPGR